MTEISTKKTWYLLFAAWVIAFVASLGSLFFSEIMEYPPCVLCWYQRIAMYPLVVMLLSGIFPADGRVIKFALPQVGIGGMIAFFHNLLYYELIPESAAPCAKGISCTTTHLEWLGFVTIPLLSLIAFVLIFILLFLARKSADEN